MQFVTYIAAFIFVLALIGLGAWLLRNVLLRNGSPGLRFFAPKERRLGVIEATAVDSRRKLVLLRRDEVQHLIMTGGPVDVVIETNISPNAAFGGTLNDIHDVDGSDRRSAIIASGKDRLAEDED